MKYFIIRPAVPAGIGENSIIEREVGVPLKIIKLHLIFEAYEDTDLMKTSPVFYVSKKLKEGLKNSSLTGIQGFETFEATKSDMFEEMYPSRELPQLYWFKIDGASKRNDFGVEQGKLIISEKAKEFIESYNLGSASFSEV